MTKNLLTQLAIVSILNNVLFFLFLNSNALTNSLDSHTYTLWIELTWLFSLTGLIILPTVICTLLSPNRFRNQKFAISSIILSVISIAVFTINTIL